MTFAFTVLLILLASSSSSAISKSSSRCFESIVSFGDSLTDTGNYGLLCPRNDPPNTSRLPYGRTFFHFPTGRCSDGRLVIDFIAQSLGLQLVQPYIASERGSVDGLSFSEGVNFAVAGATALGNQYYEKLGIHVPVADASLGIQFDWFKQFLAEIPDGRNFLQKSLVIMGEVGGNDYNYPIQLGMSPEFIHSLVPPVIDCIGSKIEVLIKLGVKTMLVPGNLPLGCLPIFLTQFKTTTSAKDYDPETGCLSWLNELGTYHDNLLVKELNRIRKLYPRVTIIYADYYNPTISFYRSPNEFGFTRGIHRACCGSGGPYNYNGTALCGIPPATSCDDPSKFVSWDGMHLTEAAYRLIAQGLLHNITTTLCPNYDLHVGAKSSL